MALSGTPVQNNTFDLYAQMNFLNPGMLGSREFFMNEFATPIDKFQEDEVKQQLRKLTYPFLLRRTKEQVAKDLPEKTEMISVLRNGHRAAQDIRCLSQYLPRADNGYDRRARHGALADAHLAGPYQAAPDMRFACHTERRRELS
ncbi:MAG: SNF2-related protein [Luteolibacter sp.]